MMCECENIGKIHAFCCSRLVAQVASVSNVRAADVPCVWNPSSPRASLQTHARKTCTTGEKHNDFMHNKTQPKKHGARSARTLRHERLLLGRELDGPRQRPLERARDRVFAGPVVRRHALRHGVTPQEERFGPERGWGRAVSKHPG
jgi:hypothetical protein